MTVYYKIMYRILILSTLGIAMSCMLYLGTHVYAHNTTGYRNSLFYKDGSLANCWCYDGQEWYFFQNGKKYTGLAIDNNGERAFQDGEYLTGYQNDLFYDKGSLANWWCHDGLDWYFFQEGKRYTGYAEDDSGEKYFVNGEYANGIYNSTLYKDGAESSGNEYVNDIFYDEDKEPANLWCYDGQEWYFFQNGKKYTGLAIDNNGERAFQDGEYLTGYQNDLFYDKGSLANWWCHDGLDWYFFQEGKRYTGLAADEYGEHYFENGRYFTGYVGDIFYEEGLPCNWWCDDGRTQRFFQSGRRYTGYAEDAGGEKYFIDGKYARGYHDGKYFTDGVEVELPESVQLEHNIYAYDFDTYYYPTGCWLLSAASGLYSKGVQVNPDALLSYLPKTGDPRSGVMGNPKLSEYKYESYPTAWTTGLLPTLKQYLSTVDNPSVEYGAYPTAWPTGLLPTLKRYLPTADNFSGASFEDIKYELSQGNTVQIWFTRIKPDVYLDAGNGGFYASRDYHTILITGYDDTGFYIIESWGNLYNYHIDYNSSENLRYPYLKDSYEAFGSMAIVYR